MTSTGEQREALERTARLLALGRRPRRRPADALVEDLEERGPARLEELLRSGPTGMLGDPRTQLALGAASLADLEAARELCKRGVPGDLREHLEELAGYFVTTAAARVHHRARIGSAPPRELEAVLLDLAAATEEPWRSFFRRAATAD